MLQRRTARWGRGRTPGLMFNSNFLSARCTSKTEGVIITGVLQDGPAAQAGMRPGDVILKVDDKAVGNVSQLLTAVAALKPGTPSAFEVQRADKKLELNINPGVRPRPQRAVRR